MSRIKRNNRLLVDKKSGHAIVMLGYPFNSRRVLVDKSVAILTDPRYIGRKLNTYRERLSPAYKVNAASGRQTSSKRAYSNNYEQVEVNTRAVEALKNQKIVESQLYVNVVNDLIISPVKPIKKKWQLTSIAFESKKHVQDTISRSLENYLEHATIAIHHLNQIQELGTMINQGTSNIRVVHGRPTDDRADLVQKFTVIGRFLSNSYRQNEVIVADEQVIIDNFKKLPKEEQLVEYERLKKVFFSIV